MAIKRIRLMIVDDSVFFREFMHRALASNSSVEVVGIASSAIEAIDKVDVCKPEVIALDMEMPKMRGTEFLQRILPKHPGVRVIVISSNPNNAFDAVKAGAIDFVPKPSAQVGMNNDQFIREMVNKIKIAVYSQIPKSGIPVPSAAPVPRSVAVEPLMPIPQSISVRNPKSIIAIGASTGGTEAILAVIKDLPANSPGIIVVQHMPPTFTKMYADRLDKLCKMKVKEAEHNDKVPFGTVLIAPGDRQMRLRSDSGGYSVSVESGEKVSGHCPSVDVLFESVAKVAGANAIGVILTGMGSDGAKMLLQMKKNGAHTIGQDKDSSIVYGMPMVAYNIGGVMEQLPLNRISGAIVRKLTR